MTFFSASNLSAVRADPYSAVPQLFSCREANYRATLGSWFAAEHQEHIELSFCSLLSYELAPYGGPTGPVKTLEDLLASPVLACNNYVALAWRLFHVMRPSHATKVAAVGWNGGPVGNHSQLFFKHPTSGYGLLDPTIGLYQCGYDYDSIESGKPCAYFFRKSFYEPHQDTQQLADAVERALELGLYRPSHELYYWEDIEEFVDPAWSEYWPTPQSESVS